MKQRAIVLLSGGLDSCVTLAHALTLFDVHVLTFNYGQRHLIELSAAHRIVNHYVGHKYNIIGHDEVEIMLPWQGSALLGEGDIPKDELGQHPEPPSYVPCRNTILLSYALSCAEVAGADVIYYGANALDYSGYPDCRPEYVVAYQNMANFAGFRWVGKEGRQRMSIRAPLNLMTKKEIVEEGIRLGAPLHLTWSCYDPQPPEKEGGLFEHCGHCDSCLIRKKGFEEAGVDDPTFYVGDELEEESVLPPEALEESDAVEQPLEDGGVQTENAEETMEGDPATGEGQDNSEGQMQDSESEELGSRSS